MKKRLLLSSLLVVGLAGGCGGIATVSPDIAAQALHDRRAPVVMATDQAIEADIREALQDEYALKNQAHVNVNAYNGAVLVTGEAASSDIKNIVIGMIRITQRVKLVHDNLTIAHPSDNGSRANDAQMTANIKAALTQIRTIPGFESAMIKVVTEGAVVYLMGRVHRAEGTVVINVARHQPDIKQIVTVFEYLD